MKRLVTLPRISVAVVVVIVLIGALVATSALATRSDADRSPLRVAVVGGTTGRPGSTTGWCGRRSWPNERMVGRQFRTARLRLRRRRTGWARVHLPGRPSPARRPGGRPDRRRTRGHRPTGDVCDLRGGRSTRSTRAFSREGEHSSSAPLVVRVAGSGVGDPGVRRPALHRGAGRSSLLRCTRSPPVADQGSDVARSQWPHGCRAIRARRRYRHVVRTEVSR